jgi:hypothetical protein
MPRIPCAAFAFVLSTSVMAGFIPAIHFPESLQALLRLWKMDGRHEGGHDEEGE